MTASNSLKKLYRSYLDFIAAAGAGDERPPSISRSNREAIKALRTAIRAKRLALVLGAGVSAECGVPQWGKLVSGLVDSGFPPALRKRIKRSKIPLVRKIRLLEQVQKTYRLRLRDKLYRRTSVSSKTNLYHIAKFAVLMHQRGCVDRIVTYNFDDLLREEIHRRSPQRKTKLISSKTHYHLEYGKLHIIHPHGHIARDMADDDILSLALVFAEPDYHRHFLDYSFWANAAQIATFAEYVCLFIGISFDDPNHRRLLDAARNYGPADMRHVAIVKWNSDRNKDILTQRDLASFGIRPLWVKDYRRIRVLLSRLLRKD